VLTSLGSPNYLSKGESAFRLCSLFKSVARAVRGAKLLISNIINSMDLHLNNNQTMYLFLSDWGMES